VIKVVAEDFERRVIKSVDPVYLFISHRDKAKNRGLYEKFEKLAEEGKDTRTKYCKIDGVNEPQNYYLGETLP